MIKTYKYKVYKSSRLKKLDEIRRTAAWIYNHCIALHKRYYRLYGKHLTRFKLQKHIGKLRKKNHAWQKLGSQTVQDIVYRIDKAYRSFFKRAIKRPPTFRKSRKYKSFTFTQAGYKIESNKFTLNAIGLTVGFHLSRPYGEKIKTATIKRDACGDYWIILVCDVEREPIKVKTGKSAGFDFGLKTFLTSSNGKPIAAPLFHLQALKDLRQANRQLSRKKRGGNNRKRAKLHLSKVHRRIAWKRDDYQWKLANKLTDAYDYLFFEDLNLSGMKRLWGRKVSDLSFASFMHKLEYLARKKGKQAVKVDRWFASSKTCSQCGNIKEQLQLSDRVYECRQCGIVLDRDQNAAKSIHIEGASSIGLGDVRSNVLGYRRLNPESLGL